MRFLGRRQSAVAAILLLYAALFLPLMIPPRTAQDPRTNNYYHYERDALFRSIDDPLRDAIDLSAIFRLSKDDQTLLLNKINSHPGLKTFSIEDRSRSLHRGNFTIDFVSRIPAAERLILSVKPDPNELRKLCKCARLKGLVVDGWTDSHLRAISEQACWQLSSLGVSGEEISSDGFRLLASHRELHTLNLSGTMVSAADCIFLMTVLPQLQELDISHTSLSDAVEAAILHSKITTLGALGTQLSSAARQRMRDRGIEIHDVN